jgi:hypothetical protein
MKNKESENYVPVQVRAKVALIVTSIESRLVSIKRNVFEIGKYVSQLKATLPHGTFEMFLEDHFKKELPYSTANLYMKIFEKFEKHPKAVQYLPITFLLKLAHNSFPEEVFNILTENVNTDKIDIQLITDAFDQFKSGDINLSQFETLAKKQIDLAIQMEWGRTEKHNCKEISKTLHLGFRALSNAVNKIYETSNRCSHFLYPEHKQSLINDIESAIIKLTRFKDDVQNNKFFNHPQFLKVGENLLTNRKELVENELIKNSNN